MPTDSVGSILIIDDNPEFVASVMDVCERKGLHVKGCSRPADVFRWVKKDDFDFDLVLLDMCLGTFKKTGENLNAPKLLPHLMTYSPGSKVVVFSQQDISVEAALKCLELGALAILPKTADVSDLIAVANVYRMFRNQRETSESLIRWLWEMVRKSVSDNPLKGEHLEMLMINIFNSLPTFKVIAQNVETAAGQIDLIVENCNTHEFWRALDSHHLVIECKNRLKSTEVEAFNQLKEKVRTRGRLAKVGILVSVSPITRGVKARRTECKTLQDIHIYTLEMQHIERIVLLSYNEREEYLRRVLARQ